MKLIFKNLLSFFFAILTWSCQPSNNLTEAQKTAIADSARVVVQKVFDYSNKLNYKAALHFYSADADTRYIDNGSIYPSLAAMKEAYDQVGPNMELVENKIASWNTMVLAEDAVAFTLPIRLKLKAKGLPEYEGNFVWSGIVQKRMGEWKIIQSHESWENYAEVIAALSPPSQNELVSE